MSDHFLLVSDAEARLLGLLYSLGAMSALAVSLGEPEADLLEESRRLAAATLKVGAHMKMQAALRNRILELVTEADKDAERQKS